MVTAAILAGGRATRLGGGDKSALLIGGVPMLERQVALLRQISPDVVIIADDTRRFARAGVPVLTDRHRQCGPLGGLHTALRAAPSSHVLVVACDLPFLTRAFLTHLIELCEDVDAVVPRDASGQHPLCAVYASRLAPQLERRLDAGLRKMTDLLTTLTVRDVGPESVARFDPGGVLLTNVNTPEDYDRAQAVVTPVRA
jgi:molybdopterin-guanine dinucleotide biosynthesis protein A